MKKIFVSIAAIALAFTACSPDDNGDNGGTQTITCVEHDFEITANTLCGNYFHLDYSDDSYNYNIFLSTDKGCELVDSATGFLNVREGQPIYSLDLYAPIPSLDLNRQFNVPIGSYTFDLEDSCNSGTIAASSTYMYLLNSESYDYERTTFVAGSVDVTKSCIVAILIDDKGKTHHIRYDGELSVDNSNNFAIFKDDWSRSTLTSDLQLSFAENESIAMVNGENADYYHIGMSCWYVVFYEPVTDSQFTLEVLAPADAKKLVGEFPVSKDWNNKQMVLPGFAWNIDYTFWSWYDLYDGNKWIGGSPLTEGKMVISENADGTQHIVMDVKDDAGHSIKAEFDTDMYSNDGASLLSTRGSATLMNKPRVHKPVLHKKMYQPIKR